MGDVHMAKKSNPKGTGEVELVLIVPQPAQATPVRDRAGGEQHTGALARIFGAQKVTKSVESFQEDLGKLAGAVDTFIETISQKVGSKVRFKELEVALAISAEGSIGFATAGVETTFTVTFERRESKSGQ
jgi:hypothetical protein